MIDEIFEFFEEENLKKQSYYHGTTDLFKISEIKSPIDTENIREDFRKRNRDVVYITTSFGSAQKYAYKATKKFGGKPIVYKVEPDWDSLIKRLDCEYIAKSAKILDYSLDI